MFAKPIQELSLSDIQNLITNERLSESERIEYKEKLPDDGKNGDPWYRGENKIGNLALKKLASEIVAFANTHGGTLILGIEESNEQPSRPVSIKPLPRCPELNERLMQSIADSINPRIDNLQSKVIECDDTHNGLIVISVPRSEYAPHRSTRDNEFYKREQHECKRMNAPEIKALALKRSRQRVEALWTIKYRTTNNNFINGGVVVFNEGKIYGGDSQYYCTGIYELTEDDRIIASVQVEHYHGDRSTAFGTIDNSLFLSIFGNFMNNKISGTAFNSNTSTGIPFVMEKKKVLP